MNVAAVRDTCKGIFGNVPDCKLFSFDDLMNRGADIERGLTILSDHVSKLSALAYERAQDDLLLFAERVLEWCIAGYAKIFPKVAESLGPALKDLLTSVSSRGQSYDRNLVWPTVVRACR